jgi:hypothetical protein
MQKFLDIVEMLPNNQLQDSWCINPELLKRQYLIYRSILINYLIDRIMEDLEQTPFNVKDRFEYSGL